MNKIPLNCIHKLIYFHPIIKPCGNVHNVPNTDLIWVQLALVHRVGVLNDFYLVLSKSLSIETLKRKSLITF